MWETLWSIKDTIVAAICGALIIYCDRDLKRLTGQGYVNLFIPLTKPEPTTSTEVFDVHAQNLPRLPSVAQHR